MDNKLWIVHGGSDSYFAARDAKDAWQVVQEMNNIAMEYDMYPTSRVEVISNNDKESIELHAEELVIRDEEGDELYFMP
jgi:uncharacterized protein YrzB (UPF0473 family)